MSRPRRRRKNRERGRGKPNVEPEGVGTPEQPEMPELPENAKYFEEDELHGKVVVTLKEKANKMFEEAAEDRNSQANQLVRILLLNQLANMHPARYQKDPRLVVTEERHRGFEAEKKAEIDKHKVALLKQRVKKLEEEIEAAKLRSQQLQQDIEQGEYKLAEARRLAQNAQAAAEHGKPLDPMSVYTRIARIIGLRSPAEQAADPGAAKS